MENLKIDSRLKKQLTSLLRKVKGLQAARMFAKPVDAVALKIPDYYTVIKNPMDLSTIESKLESNKYTYVRDFIADFDLMFLNCRTYNKSTLGTVRKTCDSLEESFRNYLSKLAKNYESAPGIAVKEVDTTPPPSTSLKLSLTIGPSGTMSLKPVEPMESVAEEPVPPVEPVVEDPMEKWKKWVHKFMRKIYKKGLLNGIAEFSFDYLNTLLAGSDRVSIKDYLLPILYKLPKPERYLKRWNKKWDRLQEKLPTVTTIKLGGIPEALPIEEPANEPPVVEMEDIPVVEPLEQPVEDEKNHTIKIRFNEEDLKKATEAPSFEEPEPIQEENEETKVVIQNFSLIKSLATDRQSRPTKTPKQRSAMSVTLPSLDSIQKISSVVAAAEEVEIDPKLKESYTQKDLFPIDTETRENIKAYIMETWGKLRQETRPLVRVEPIKEKKPPSMLVRIEDEATNFDTENSGFGNIVIELKPDNEAMHY